MVRALRRAAGAALAAAAARAGAPPAAGVGCAEGEWRCGAAEVHVERDVFFWSGTSLWDGQVHNFTADVYACAGAPAAPRPAVVVAHGYLEKRNGTKQSQWAAHLARLGYAVASINYGTEGPPGARGALAAAARGDPCLDADAPGSGQAEPWSRAVRCGLRWLVERANVGADPGRLACLGDSQGAIACDDALATVDNVTAMRAYQPRAAVSISGACTDCPLPHAPRLPASLMEFHGTADTAIPIAKAYDMLSELRGWGVEVRNVTLPDAGHVPWDDVWDRRDDVAAFFCSSLYPSRTGA